MAEGNAPQAMPPDAESRARLAQSGDRRDQDGNALPRAGLAGGEPRGQVVGDLGRLHDDLPRAMKSLDDEGAQGVGRVGRVVAHDDGQRRGFAPSRVLRHDSPRCPRTNWLSRSFLRRISAMGRRTRKMSRSRIE